MPDMGLGDARADARETSFNTAFGSGDSYFFYIGETGITPRIPAKNGSLEGVYRIGVWNDPQPKGHADGNLRAVIN